MYKYFFCTENGGTYKKHLSRLRKNGRFFNTVKIIFLHLQTV
jgi:hypothetical protein